MRSSKEMLSGYMALVLIVGLVAVVGLLSLFSNTEMDDYSVNENNLIGNAKMSINNAGAEKTISSKPTDFSTETIDLKGELLDPENNFNLVQSILQQEIIPTFHSSMLKSQMRSTIEFNQSEINQSSFEEGSIVLLEGTYYLTEDIVLNGLTHIFLEGDAELNCNGFSIQGDGIINDAPFSEEIIDLNDVTFGVNLNDNSRLVNCDISLFQINVIAYDNSVIENGVLDRFLNMGLLVLGPITATGDLSVSYNSLVREQIPSPGVFPQTALLINSVQGATFENVIADDNNFYGTFIIDSSRISMGRFTSSNNFRCVRLNGVYESKFKSISCESEDVGFISDTSSNNVFNTIESTGNNFYGILAYESYNNNFVQVSTSNNDFGVLISHSNFNTFSKVKSNYDLSFLALLSSSNNYFENVTALNISITGVNLHESNDNEFKKIDVSNLGGSGVSLVSNSINNIFEKIIVSEAARGVYVGDSYQNTFESIYCDEIGHSGLHLVDSSNNLFKKVDIDRGNIDSNNAVNYNRGNIHLYRSNNNEFERVNSRYSQTASGLYMFQSSDNVFSIQSSFSDNYLRGINLEFDSSGNTFNELFLTNNEGEGMRVSGSDSANFGNVVSTSNTVAGIDIRFSENINFNSISIDGNRLSSQLGMGLEQVDNFEVLNQPIEVQNNQLGIYLEDTPYDFLVYFRGNEEDIVIVE